MSTPDVVHDFNGTAPEPIVSPRSSHSTPRKRDAKIYAEQTDDNVVNILGTTVKVSEKNSMLKQKLAQLDLNNDGVVSEDELLNFLAESAFQKKLNSMLYKIVVGAFIMLICLTGALTYSTYAVVEQSKESHVSDSSTGAYLTDTVSFLIYDPYDYIALIARSYNSSLWQYRKEALWW